LDLGIRGLLYVTLELFGHLGPPFVVVRLP